jgi:hypothetical protein
VVETVAGMVAPPFEGTTTGVAITDPWFAVAVAVGVGVGVGVGRVIYYLYICFIIIIMQYNYIFKGI